MKKFVVTIRETLAVKVPVMAETREEAELDVRERYYDCEFVLSSDELTDIDFQVEEAVS